MLSICGDRRANTTTTPPPPGPQAHNDPDPCLSPSISPPSRFPASSVPQSPGCLAAPRPLVPWNLAHLAHTVLEKEIHFLSAASTPWKSKPLPALSNLQSFHSHPVHSKHESRLRILTHGYTDSAVGFFFRGQNTTRWNSLLCLHRNLSLAATSHFKWAANMQQLHILRHHSQRTPASPTLYRIKHKEYPGRTLPLPLNTQRYFPLQAALAEKLVHAGG
jgi:hypothetical protein